MSRVIFLFFFKTIGFGKKPKTTPQLVILNPTSQFGVSVKIKMRPAILKEKYKKTNP